MTAALDPPRALQLIAEAVARMEWKPDGDLDSQYVDGWNDALADRAQPLADQLEAALAEIERLRAPADLGSLRDVAATATEDVAEYRTPLGTMATWDDRRVGRMIFRDEIIARDLPGALAELERLRGKKVGRP